MIKLTPTLWSILLGDIIDQIIDMYRSWVDHYPSRPHVYLDGLDFQVPFLAGVRDSVSWDAFHTTRPGQLSHLRRISDEAHSQGYESILFPLHDPRRDHYVAARLDLRRQLLSIGDSLGGQPIDSISPPDLHGIRLFAIKANAPLREEVAELPHSHQVDPFSCGIATCNALERQVYL